MRTISEFMNRKTAVISFGRLNPVTTGHLHLMKKIVSVASKEHGTAMLYTSHTQDKKKNPLDYESKIKYIKLSAPNGITIVHSPAKTIIDVLKELSEKGFTDIIMVVGSDRIADFKKFGKYKDDFNIKSFSVISSGERDADSEDEIASISASKQREYAKNDDFENFKKGCPLKDTQAKNMFKDVRRGLGL